MERLTEISLITDLPMPVKLMESCGEDGCNGACEEYIDKNCIGCPVQECMTKLHQYQSTNLEPEEIEQLKIDNEYWHNEALRWAAELGELKFKIVTLIENNSK